MNERKIPIHVRRALAEGNIKEANKMLRDVYSLRGIVVKGQQLGRVLGYPTANLKLHGQTPLFLANGVYAVKVSLDNALYGGMANIGIRPTMEQHELTVEVNIFDFDSNIYDQEILVHFIERIRDEQKFASLEELKQQLAKDKLTVTGLFASGMHPDPHSK
jgi:riboflavin kinase / FMN adenylyltransferase